MCCTNTYFPFLSRRNFSYVDVLLKFRKIDYINGFGTFLDPNTVKATLKNGSEKILKASHVIIAVGGRPKYLDVPGKDHCISSDDIFSLQKPPGRTLVVGAGCILFT